MFFELLPSEKRYRNLGYSGMSTRTSNRLYPTAVRVLNYVFNQRYITCYFRYYILYKRLKQKTKVVWPLLEARTRHHLSEIVATRRFWEKEQRSTEKEMEGQLKGRYEEIPTD